MARQAAAVVIAMAAGGAPGAVDGDRRLPFGEDFAFGVAAAGASKTIAAPVERVKLLLQCQPEMMKTGRLDREYRGIVDCTRRIVVGEGVSALWRGNAPNVVRCVPTNVLQFAFK